MQLHGLISPAYCREKRASSKQDHDDCRLLASHHRPAPSHIKPYCESETAMQHYEQRPAQEAQNNDKYFEEMFGFQYL